ncbi:FIG01209012: hypothetical protein [hydrothermal vent metagenome]|uniref:NosL family protein n=1 Tax=hydrothermal vent metagenome TaxID=652676 RepID=A0A1W1CCD5_9ZZZZ
MNKIVLALVTLVAITTASNAQMKCGEGKCGAAMKSGDAAPKKMMKMFQSVPKEKATILQSGDAKLFCPECGMSLPMFYKTNHSATVDGKVKQYCSMHCLVDDIRGGAKPTDVKVVDVHSLKFIDATKAFYVVGSSKKGTMSMVSKYAFASKVNADAFAQKNGGEVMSYDDALKRAEKEFDKDGAMIAKKQDMMASKGEMIYGKKCQKIDAKFKTTAEAKAYILAHKSCEGLNPKQLQAVGLYLSRR